MRWKISRPWSHDPRHIDLLAALALVIVIVAAWRFFSGDAYKPPSTAPSSCPAKAFAGEVASDARRTLQRENQIRSGFAEV